MKLGDIAKVKVDWMVGFSTNPQLKIVLKRGKTRAPADLFRWRQVGNLFYAAHENEVKYLWHDRRDHNGFAGSQYLLHMHDDWDSAGFRPCDHHERRWGSGGQSFNPKCTLDGRVVTLTGPWSANSGQAELAIGQPIVSASTLAGDDRESIRNPRAFEIWRRRGRHYEGTYCSASYTLSFIRDVVDALAPHLELYEGDYGWYPVRKGEQPKNPRTGPRIVSPAAMSDEQCAAIRA